MQISGQCFHLRHLPYPQRWLQCRSQTLCHQGIHAFIPSTWEIASKRAAIALSPKPNLSCCPFLSILWKIQQMRVPLWSMGAPTPRNQNWKSLSLLSLVCSQFQENALKSGQSGYPIPKEDSKKLNNWWKVACLIPTKKVLFTLGPNIKHCLNKTVRKMGFHTSAPIKWKKESNGPPKHPNKNPGKNPLLQFHQSQAI